MIAATLNRLPAQHAGRAYGLLGFGMWGFGPIYFKALAHIQPGEVLAHRIL